MKKYKLLTYYLLAASLLGAQTLDFGIANKEITATDVTFDVTLATDTPFKLGSGQLYFNYNSAAFGALVVDNGAVTISYPAGSVLGQINALPIYNQFITNDNLSDRFSFAWQQALSSGGIPENNITNTPAVLFQVTIDFAAGGASESDDICFEDGEVFDDQTFTACGPDFFTFSDCFNEPGLQLTDDNFDCTSALPVELLDFRATAQEDFTTLLTWQTAQEYNNYYFTIERSTDGRAFTELEKVPGAGFSDTPRSYQTLDPLPHPGINYYRLKQTDYDGAFSYSDIRAVRFERAATDALAVYPNPTRGMTTLVIPEALSTGRLRVYDTAGRLVYERPLMGRSPTFELDVRAWPAGTYWLRIDGNGKGASERLVVMDEY